MKKLLTVIILCISMLLIGQISRNVTDAKMDQLFFENASACRHFGLIQQDELDNYKEYGTEIYGIGMFDDQRGSVFGDSFELPEGFRVKECFALAMNSSGMEEVHEDFAANPREFLVTFYLCENPSNIVPIFEYHGLSLLACYEGTFYQITNEKWLTYVFDELCYIEPYAVRNPILSLLQGLE